MSSTIEMLIQDRPSAGQRLAGALMKYRKRKDALVLAIAPRGVPVAAEVARILQAPLDVTVIRKLDVPGAAGEHMGAIAAGGARALDWGIVSGLDVSDEALDAICARELAEAERLMQTYRGYRLLPELRGRPVILVDEGLETGASIRAAIAAVRAQQPAKLILAVPVAPFDVLTQVREDVDEVVCIGTPYPYGAIAKWYWDFPEVTAQTVCETLAARWAADDARAAAVKPTKKRVAPVARAAAAPSRAAGAASNHRGSV